MFKTFFMAPESYYSSSWTVGNDEWNGIDGSAVNEMKMMVRDAIRDAISGCVADQ